MDTVKDARGVDWKLAENHHIIIISHIKNETKRTLASQGCSEQTSIYFEKTLKKLHDEGIIDMSIKYDRLEKKFKELNQALTRTRPRVERVDRHIICVASQIASHICSGDGGISIAIEKIKKSHFLRRWSEYAHGVTVQPTDV